MARPKLIELLQAQCEAGLKSWFSVYSTFLPFTDNLTPVQQAEWERIERGIHEITKHHDDALAEYESVIANGTPEQQKTSASRFMAVLEQNFEVLAQFTRDTRRLLIDSVASD